MNADSTAAGTTKVLSLLEGFSTVMFLTRSVQGGMHARPMAIAARGADLELQFVTDIESAKVHEISRDTASQVICQKDGSVYLTLAGASTLSQDRERLKAVWNECLRVWFPDGVEDPKICLITFRTLRAEYWDHAGMNKLAYLWEAAKAYVSGDRVSTTGSETHGVVKL